MRIGRQGHRSALPALLLLVVAGAHARVAEEQLAQLGTSLTPVGAEAAANADGSIPAWDGGLVAAPECFAGAGSRYCDPFPDDAPLFTISVENLSRYEEYLSEAQAALLRRYPDSYRMPVYATRRSFANPVFVYEASRANALRAELQGNGEVLSGAVTGVPFPIPGNAFEVIWNHKVRYRDVSVRRWNNQFAVAASGDYNQTTIREDLRFMYSRPGLAPEALGEVLYHALELVTAPPRLEGSILLLHETRDQIAEARRIWQHSPGQQRLRRVPNAGHDTPALGADGLRTHDQADMFNGPTERYEWKLIGKREMFVPANSYRLHSDALEYSQIVGKHHLAQEHTRYERRRVWEVEATLRPGSGHRYKRRRFFVDEDGWQIRVVDVYDARGALWQLQEAHTVIAYDKPYELPVCETVYDLPGNRYLAQALNNEDPETATWVFDEDHFEPRKVSRLAKK
ncbi:MAG: DUF1329 domain-containing protein [Sinimarinibacterium flocculans]|uniref:DUF1329 domain-containing protein n=1 Tax=Sinimarinibacterium flocculans TaxID=985250 RepID=UPI003C6590DB